MKYRKLLLGTILSDESNNESYMEKLKGIDILDAIH